MAAGYDQFHRLRDCSPDCIMYITAAVPAALHHVQHYFAWAHRFSVKMQIHRYDGERESSCVPADERIAVPLPKPGMYVVHAELAHAFSPRSILRSSSYFYVSGELSVADAFAAVSKGLSPAAVYPHWRTRHPSAVRRHELSSGSAPMRVGMIAIGACQTQKSP